MGAAVKRVLVTGATGCVGQFVLPRLVQRGWDVSAVRSHRPAVDVTGVKWFQANLLDPADAKRVANESRTTQLLHLAWSIPPGQWAASPENFDWVRASLDLVSAFKASGGKRVVAAGSCLEYDWNAGVCSEDSTPFKPHTVYGTCKHALQLVMSAMMPTAWGRIFFLYGPNEHPDRLASSVIRSILAGRPARTSHGRQIRDYLYAEDVADAFVHLLESDFTGEMNIASGQPVELREIVQSIGQLMGRPDLIELGAIPQAATDTPKVVADVTRMKSRLGWSPSWSLTDGLAKTIHWWQERSLARESA